MAIVRIEVTAEDAASPHRTSVDRCMIGRAARRAMPGRDVKVGITLAMIDERMVRLPAEAARQAERYVAGQPVGPFAFDWDVPEQEET
jgi:hypothetical protein